MPEKDARLSLAKEGRWGGTKEGGRRRSPGCAVDPPSLRPFLAGWGLGILGRRGGVGGVIQNS